MLLSQTEVSQSVIDYIFGGRTSVKEAEQVKDLPTGISSITLRKIKDTLRNAQQGMTAEELGEKWARHGQQPAAMPNIWSLRKKRAPSWNTALSADPKENII